MRNRNKPNNTPKRFDLEEAKALAWEARQDANNATELMRYAVRAGAVSACVAFVGLALSGLSAIKTASNAQRIADVEATVQHLEQHFSRGPVLPPIAISIEDCTTDWECELMNPEWSEQVEAEAE